MRSAAELLYNFHWIVPGEAARSAQAYLGFLGPFLSAHGIRSVINLRGANEDFRWWRSEKRVTAERGIAHFDTMLNSRRLPTGQMLLDLLAAFDAAPKPLLLKCSGGQDRSSFAGALYIIHRKGWDAFAEAEQQFARWPYLHRPKAQQRWLKPFLTFARDDAKGRPLAQWIAQNYTDKRLKAWLQANSLADSFRGLYLPGTAPGA
jgi:protein tyrosine/serine phosphatase